MDQTTVERIVTGLASRYARKCWWAEKDDLEQVGRLAALRAGLTFDPHVGVPEGAYVQRAVTLSMRRWLWANSAPVSGGTADPWKDRAGLVRAPIESPEGDPLLPCRRPPPDALLSARSWVEEARERIAGLTDAEGCRLGLRVLLGERSASEVAREAGVPPKEVYQSTTEVRRRLQGSRALWAFLRGEESAAARELVRRAGWHFDPRPLWQRALERRSTLWGRALDKRQRDGYDQENP